MKVGNFGTPKHVHCKRKIGRIESEESSLQIWAWIECKIDPVTGVTRFHQKEFADAKSVSLWDRDCKQGDAKSVSVSLGHSLRLPSSCFYSKRNYSVIPAGSSLSNLNLEKMFCRCGKVTSLRTQSAGTARACAGRMCACCPRTHPVWG